MKKLFVTLAVALLTMTQVFAMSTSKIRETARFLSDRMAWELDMTPQQYDDCYEINYDFLFAISPILDDVARGYLSAINTYYTYLDWRNDDMRFILTQHLQALFWRSFPQELFGWLLSSRPSLQSFD